MICPNFSSSSSWVSAPSVWRSSASSISTSPLEAERRDFVDLALFDRDLLRDCVARMSSRLGGSAVSRALQRSFACRRNVARSSSRRSSPASEALVRPIDHSSCPLLSAAESLWGLGILAGGRGHAVHSLDGIRLVCVSPETSVYSSASPLFSHCSLFCQDLTPANSSAGRLTRRLSACALYKCAARSLFCICSSDVAMLRSAAV
jgi:hypothetical protein